jgi:signal transduction histidine kinase
LFAAPFTTPHHTWRHIAEAVGVVALGLGAALMTFVAGADALVFVLAPLLVLHAVRLGLGGAMLGLTLQIGVATWATGGGLGPLAQFDQPLLALALFVGGMATLGLPLALVLRHLREQSSAKADFLAHMSHDIRTPMNGVLGFADLLRQQGGLTPDQRRSVDHIAQSGQTMVRLLNDILDFSRLEAGHMVLEQAEISLHDELEYCLGLFRPRAAEKGIQLSCIVDETVPQRITGDPLRLRQVLLNLIGNAVKFTDHGTVQLHARAQRGVLSTHLSLEVSDTGIGIAPDALGRIFGRYSQADSSTARKHGGSGLGLAICKQLVELMDGRVLATSQPGRGTVFTVHLPVRELAATAEVVHPRFSAAA